MRLLVSTLELKQIENEFESNLFGSKLTRSSWSLKSSFMSGFILFVVYFSTVIHLVEVNGGRISPIDEWAYVDSIFQSSQGEVVRPGELVSDEAKDYLACHEVYGVGALGSGCGAEVQQPTAFPLDKSPAEIHPPTYFLITSLFGKTLNSFFNQFDLIDSSRLVGSLWLFIGMGLWMRIFQNLGVKLTSATAICIIVGTSPLVQSTNSFITPDAAFAFTSGLVTLATLKWFRGESSYVILIIASIVPVFFKVTHLLSAILLSIFVLSLFLTGQKFKSHKELLVGSMCLMLGSLIGLVAWQVIRFAIRVSSSPTHPNAEPAINFQSFFQILGYHIANGPSSSGSIIPTPWLSVSIAQIFSWMILSAALGGFMYSTNGAAFRNLCATSAFAYIFGAIVLSLITLVLSGGFLIATPRYGLPLLMFATLPLALSANRKSISYILSIMATASYVSIIIWM